jgi:hypothetical protein
MEFKTCNLERDRMEVVRFISPCLLGKKNNIGFVDGAEISRKRVEVIKRGKEGVFDQVPVLYVEGRPKPIRPRA